MRETYRPKPSLALDHLLEKNIPVVLVSRCFNGVVEGVYDYDGGGRQLEKKGVIFCNGLNSQKARLKLLVGLNAWSGRQAALRFFSGTCVKKKALTHASKLLWSRLVSNRRPLPCRGSALPTELRNRTNYDYKRRTKICQSLFKKKKTYL